ncbi:MAG: RHS repeat domain-containing protein, partial [Methyloceanibacter sp.]
FQRPTPQWLYYTTDHLGSVRLVSAQNMTAIRRDFKPFGEQIAGDPTGETTAPLRFAAMERDRTDASALDYDHARFHAPPVGRFLSVDLMGGARSTPNSWNRYAYVLGNPIKYFDPSGLADQCVFNGEREICTATAPKPPEDPGYDPDRGAKSLIDLIQGSSFLLSVVGGSSPTATANPTAPQQKPMRPCDDADRLYDATLGRLPSVGVGSSFQIPGLSLGILGIGVDVDISVNWRDRSVEAYGGIGIVIGGFARIKPEGQITYTIPGSGKEPMGAGGRMSATMPGLIGTVSQSGVKQVSVGYTAGWSLAAVPAGYRGKVGLASPCQ